MRFILCARTCVRVCIQGWHLGTVTVASGAVLAFGFITLFCAAQPTTRKFAYDIFLLVHKIVAWLLFMLTFLHVSRWWMRDVTSRADSEEERYED